MNDVADAIFLAACSVGYPRLPIRGVPGKPQAKAGPGAEAWRKVADWVARPGTDPRILASVVTAIDAEAKRVNEMLEGMFD